MESAETAEPSPAELETKIFREKQKKKRKKKLQPPNSMISKHTQKETSNYVVYLPWVSLAACQQEHSEDTGGHPQ